MEPRITPAPLLADRAQTSLPFRPLTTTFTPPSGCDAFSYSGVWVLEQAATCYPSGMQITSDAYFSPGVQCPSGYYTACQDSDGNPTLTTVTCCPTSSDISLSCVTDSTLKGVWATLFCTWIAPSITVVSIVDGLTTSSITMSPPEGFNAYGVRMLYESTDPAQTSSTATATSTSSTATSSSAAPSSRSSSGGLSTGGIIAIAVVIPVVALLAVGIVFLVWSRKRRANRYQPGPPAYPADQQGKWELSPGPSEMYTAVPAAAQELPNNQAVYHELPSGGQG